jgi:uncharacterized membrane protein YdjX (TVP38/TMEM64 family)
MILASFWWYLRNQNLSATELMQVWLNQISSSAWGPLLLLAIFALRPLLLLPITILNAFAGFLFGPLWGFSYALAATLLSSGLAYLFGRLLGKPPSNAANKLLKALKERSFETILISRLIFLPGDLVNYAAGFLRISFLAFMAATALGGAASLLMTVLAGAAIRGPFDPRELKINVWYILAAAVLLFISLGLARYLRRQASV